MALAERGEPRGADDVLDAATRAASLDVVEGGRSDDLEAIPFVTADEADELRARRPRRRFGSLITAAGVAALLMVGMLAVTSFVGHGGATSPEEAVKRLADAMSHEDPLAAADVIAPSEVRSLHTTLNSAEQRAAELKLVENAGAPLSGVDFSVDDLQLSAQPLADGYVKVVVNQGTLHASTHTTKFSPLMQKALRNSTDNSADFDLAALASSNELPTFVVAVREDGHWYVSAAYTVLEYIREANHLTAPVDFGSGVRAMSTLGADTPEAAVQQGLQALSANDWDKAFSVVTPDEIPFYDYRQVLDEAFRQDNVRTKFNIAKLDTTADVHGDTATVTVHASGKTESGGDWRLDGGCITTPEQGYGSDYYFSSSAGVLCYDGARVPTSFLSVFGYASDSTNATASTQAITTVQRNGRWFVSPMGTALDIIDHWIGRLDQDGLHRILRLYSEVTPDGAVQLGVPITVPVTTSLYEPRIYTFDGHKGEKLLASAKPQDKYSGAVDVQIFRPDGSAVGDSYGITDGHAVTLPDDGTYRLLISNYSNSERTLTVWNEADAPAAAHKATDGYQYTEDPCLPNIDGGYPESCSSSSSDSSVSVPAAGDGFGQAQPCVVTGTGDNTTCVPVPDNIDVTPSTIESSANVGG
jgi:hypothetical protein